MSIPNLPNIPNIQKVTIPSLHGPTITAEKISLAPIALPPVKLPNIDVPKPSVSLPTVPPFPAPPALPGSPIKDKLTALSVPSPPGVFAIGVVIAMLGMLAKMTIDLKSAKITIPGADEFGDQFKDLATPPPAPLPVTLPIIKQLSNSYNEINQPVLEALVNVDSVPTNYTFNFNDTNDFSNSLDTYTGVVNDASDTTIKATVIDELVNKKSYYYRLSLQNANGNAVSDTKTLTFIGQVIKDMPLIHSLSNTFNKNGFPIFNANVNVSSVPTRYTFEIGKVVDDLNPIKLVGFVNAHDNVDISATLNDKQSEELMSGVQYFYDLKLENINGSEVSQTLSFIAGETK